MLNLNMMSTLSGCVPAITNMDCSLPHRAENRPATGDDIFYTCSSITCAGVSSTLCDYSHDFLKKSMN